jgi:hypothetical protein
LSHPQQWGASPPPFLPSATAHPLAAFTSSSTLRNEQTRNMRLLHTSALTLHEFFDENVPSYGILSHTWVEGEEVSYQEMSNLSPSAKTKSGYKKITKCAERVKQLGFDYVWIDSCCIDKSSSAELTESINSMYRWYEKSETCLAYMVDVHLDENTLDESNLEKDPELIGPKGSKTLRRYPGFSSSRWFTRGWTLQELIAPRNLEFYDSDWRIIATIQDVAREIEKFTAIPKAVLLSGATEAYCVAEKMKWASKRATTRREDMAYCLLGLFDINMPLLYGEGDRAFKRLQEEILKSSEDLSIFLWQDSDDSECVHRGLLAQSPAEFSNFALSWACVAEHWTTPEDFHDKTWTTPQQPCWITNIGLQLKIELLDPRTYFKTAMYNDSTTFYNDLEPKDDEYVFNVTNFQVGTYLVSFYILLKRLQKEGSQFARLRPGRIVQLGRMIEQNYQPRGQLETVFIRDKLKIEPSIVDPRFYGFRFHFWSITKPDIAFSIRQATDPTGQACSSGVMGKIDGEILLPAVESQDGAVSGMLLHLSHQNTASTVCVVFNYRPWRDPGTDEVQLKYFGEESAPALLAMRSFSDISSSQPGISPANLRAWTILPKPVIYEIHRGRLVARITLTIIKNFFLTSSQSFS